MTNLESDSKELSDSLNQVAGHKVEDFPLCGSIPPYTKHAVSVSLPLWQDNVDYEEGNPRVLNVMKFGYPRFCIHESVKKLNLRLAKILGQTVLVNYTFPSKKVVESCLYYLNSIVVEDEDKEFLKQVKVTEYKLQENDTNTTINLYLIFFPSKLEKFAKSFWQHTGEIISSRLADTCLAIIEKENELENGFKSRKLRYTKPDTKPNFEESDVGNEEVYFEERFGRNLAPNLVRNAKLALKRRLSSNKYFDSDSLSESTTGNEDWNDVYLYPTGMSAIYNAHQILLKINSSLKSVCFGFPYTDTLKVLQKFGPGCHFLGFGDDNDIIKLETLLQSEQILALFVEFPGNPLLKSPDLAKLKQLSLQHKFAIVVDDTIATSINLDINDYCDIRVSSLTKIFSGDSNVMGGSLIVSKSSPSYDQLKLSLNHNYEDNLFYKDAIFLERNSRTYVERIYQINRDTETLVDYLITHPKILQVYYPKLTTVNNYHQFQRKDTQSGYGGLFSVTFKTEQQAIQFYDNLNCAKGPSLGTNFTLACPYTLLAHYYELEWAKQFDVVKSLVRVSVGLEGSKHLLETFKLALEKVDE